MRAEPDRVRSVLIATNIDVVILYPASQALDHDVAQSTSFTVHADYNTIAFEYPGEGINSKLAAPGQC